MSLSTDDGRSVELHADDEQDVPSSSALVETPQLLPPIPFPSESFSDSFDSITGRRTSRPVSRATSIASRRMSYMTELRSKRDRSDTASLMTVDEITAEVESRRASVSADNGSDIEEWTRVDSDDGLESDTVEDVPKEIEDELEKEKKVFEPFEDDEETMLDDEDDEDEAPETVTSRGGKLYHLML